MKDNFNECLKAVLHHEGGFVNDPRDSGGITNLGCTKAVWEEWVGHSVTEKIMRDLKPENVAPLYKKRYWDRVKGDFLPNGLDYAVFDASINSGSGRASKWLQEVLVVTIDGSIGNQTLLALKDHKIKSLISQFNDTRLQFLEALPTWGTFGKGWSRRVSEVQSKASQMSEIKNDT